MEKPEFNTKHTPEEVKKKLNEKERNLKNKKGRLQKIKEATEQETEQKTEKAAESSEPAKEKKPAEFPVDAKINDYGFLHFRVGVLKVLNWKKGMPVKISKNPDGSVTVRKV